jgi:predicted dehydrogenase
MAVALAIIGYGIMGERLLRAALDHDDPSVRIAGVFDPSPAALGRLAMAFPSVPRLASADAAIDVAECIYVASPPATHLGYATQALERRRALFCEKPLAVDLPEARAFVASAEREGARAAVNFPFASAFAVDQLRAWVADGALGTPQRLTIEVAFVAWPRPWQVAAAGWLERRAQGGFTREVVSHFLFLARRLLGPLRLHAGKATYPGGEGSETALHASLDARGIPVTITGAVGATGQPDHNLWVLEGSNGAIRLRDWAIAERLGADGSWQADPDALPNEALRPLVLRRQLDKVARMTLGGDHDLASLGEALEVQEIVEAMLAGR